MTTDYDKIRNFFYREFRKRGKQVYWKGDVLKGKVFAIYHRDKRITVFMRIKKYNFKDKFNKYHRRFEVGKQMLEKIHELANEGEKIKILLVWYDSEGCVFRFFELGDSLRIMGINRKKFVVSHTFRIGNHKNHFLKFPKELMT